MAQDIFAPKSSFDIGYERPQEGVVDNTEKIKADFMSMALGAQAKSVQGQAMIENTQANLLQSSIAMAGDAYTVYSKGREKATIDTMLSKIESVDAQSDQKGMSFEARRAGYGKAIQEAASKLPGGYRDLAKYNATLKAKTGLDFTDIQKSTEATQFEAMQRDPKFMTAYLASKTLNPNFTADQHATFAQNEAAESAAAELMATTANRDDIKTYYGKIRPALQRRVQNLNNAIIASIQLKKESGQPITTLDIENLEASVAQSKLLINMSIPNSVPEDERSNYSEYFQDLDNLLTQIKESKDPDKIATGVASYLAESERLGGGTMGDIVAGAKIVDVNILTTPQGLEIFKNINTKLSDGSSTAAISSKGDLGSIFDSLIEARQGEVIGPNTIMTQEELDVAFSTKGLKPEDLMTERATGLGLIKNLEVGDLATDKGKRQLVSGIASVVKSLNNLDLQQTGSKLNELVVDSGLIEKINMLDSYDKATANQIRTLLNSAVTNNLRFSEQKIFKLEKEGVDQSNRIMSLVWDEGTKTYYATSQDYIDHLRRGPSEMRAYVETNLSGKGLPIPRNSQYASDNLQRAYKHREVLDVANRILGQTKVEDISIIEPSIESDIRSIRNNNPGNIDRTSTQWQGMAEEQTDSRFVTFESPEMGVRAMARTLNTYNTRYGLDDISGMVSRWAPPSENDTQAYIRFVSEKTGIPSNRKITLQDNPEEMKKVISAMIEMEGGQEAANYFNSRIVDRGVNLALSSKDSDNPVDSSMDSNISTEFIPSQNTKDIVTTASQAIEQSGQPSSINMISSADWLTPDLEKEMRDDGININSTPFFTSEKELENAIASGSVKVGQQVLLLVDDQPRYVKVTK